MPTDAESVGIWVFLSMSTKTNKLSQRLLLLLLSTAGVNSVAEDVETHEAHAHGAHIHGAAELTVALEKDRMELNFHSPAINVVGFEHSATTPEEIRSVEKAKRVLLDTTQLFTIAGSECTLSNSELDLSAVKGTETQNTHSDISAHYHYHCNDTSDIKSLRVGAKALPFSLKKVEVMWISDQGQGATVLTSGHQLIEFN